MVLSRPEFYLADSPHSTRYSTTNGMATKHGRQESTAVLSESVGGAQHRSGQNDQGRVDLKTASTRPLVSICRREPTSTCCKWLGRVLGGR